jgi:crotonobetainyl-CoA:carnitine CoA-transferase CaiB-like acyl-CoA transferase
MTASAGTSSEAGPLDGLRVIDLSSEITGPYASKLFADAGADVVKVEGPEGDPLRRWTASGQQLREDQDAALFQYLNASKRSAVLDLGSVAGRDRLLDLVGSSDIVIESFGPGGADALGVGWQAIQAHNPACSLVSISAWGGEGPWAKRPSTEFTLQAATGSTAHRGLPSRGPVGSGGRIGEWIPGIYAANGGLSAWLSARRTGRGHHVDLSVFECLCLSMTIYHDLNSQFFEGPLPQAIDTPSIEPTKDGWVGLCTITGQQWKDFCRTIGQAEIAEDERYYDAKVRMHHLDFIHSIIHGYTRQHTVDQIIEVMSLVRVPVNPLGNGRTLLEMDHLQAREVFVGNPAGFKQPRPPYRLSAEERTPAPRAAPRLGEHTDEILAQADAGSPPVPEGNGPLPYQGLRVIDLTAFWAGPIATSFLAELGADVIKIESIQRPDAMRFAGSVRNEAMWEFNPVNHGCNSNKRDLTLDLDSEQGLALAKRLIAKADVVAENFSPRVFENWGLGWETIQALNPRAIMLRMPSFGLDGPWRDRVGFAMNIEQVSGLAWLTGYDDLPLVVRGACDPMGGMHAVFALGLALETRRKTGRGQLVEVPLVEPAINIAAEQLIVCRSRRDRRKPGLGRHRRRERLPMERAPLRPGRPRVGSGRRARIGHGSACGARPDRRRDSGLDTRAQPRRSRRHPDGGRRAGRGMHQPALALAESPARRSRLLPGRGAFAGGCGPLSGPTHELLGTSPRAASLAGTAARRAQRSGSAPGARPWR